MKRRSFLGFTIAAAAAAGTWQTAKWLQAPAPAKEDEAAAVAAMVRQRLPYVWVRDTHLLSFARDFLRRAGSDVIALRSTSPEEFAYEASAKFLMSSDFFINGADVSRPVHYRGYYDPYNGCSSPFAKLVTPR